MISPIAILDLISLLAVLTALIILLFDSGRKFAPDIRLLLVTLLIFAAGYYLLLFLEWSLLIFYFEKSEDFIGVSLPMWWAFILYAMVNKIVTGDIRQSEEKYRQLIENYDAPIYVYDRNGTTLVMNSATAAYLNGRPEDFIGKNVSDYLPGSAPTILERNSHVIKTGIGAYYEDLIEFESGKKWFWSNYQPVKDPEGEIYAVQVLAYDVTDLKRIEEELRQAHGELEKRVEERTRELAKANEDLYREIKERKRLEKVLMQKEKLKTLGAIAAEVAHEIRNPLVSIGGFAKRLKNKFPGSQECDIILTEAQRLEKILTRISDYLEPVDLHAVDCSVNKIIKDCVGLLSPEMETRNVRCILNLSPTLTHSYADPDILSQIFINLIRKALNAMVEGGDIHIQSTENVQEILIELKNDARGLTFQDPETLFMPFSEGGQSIGLPLSYRYLKEMGGLLTFFQDKDTMVFSVSLPKSTNQKEL